MDGVGRTSRSNGVKVVLISNATLTRSCSSVIQRRPPTYLRWPVSAAIVSRTDVLVRARSCGSSESEHMCFSPRIRMCPESLIILSGLLSLGGCHFTQTDWPRGSAMESSSCHCDNIVFFRSPLLWPLGACLVSPLNARLAISGGEGREQ